MMRHFGIVFVIHAPVPVTSSASHEQQGTHKEQVSVANLATTTSI